ncbi:hypothetical protein UNSWDHB_1759 [Dehalobacter sp. UNSWDHB]|nr:hypothetical protein DHBDCA_p2522 [Dehalobacter sp. DCA]AFV06534.1 hypothetical protein DCF50_p2531 [Dehalobacter sp. CF]EQB20920.1 hypothetical protein UNSWDHB_1759 [Dehalobacter sp. UNSWDHB]
MHKIFLFLPLDKAINIFYSVSSAMEMVWMTNLYIEHLQADVSDYLAEDFLF